MRVVKFAVQIDETKCTEAKTCEEECSWANVPYCQATCPVHIDVKGYIALIREGKFDDALRLIRKHVPLPGILERVCPHPCESICKRREIDEPIAIHALKRSAGDYATGAIENPVIPPKEKERVAIVGAGPAGLSAAYYLSREGYPVTIYEKLHVPGGMMAAGIPKFRLPQDILSAEIQMIQDMGVEIKTGVTFGENITLEDLKRQGYRALFLATGLHRNLMLNVEGENLPGVFNGVEFLREANFEKRVDVGGRVIVIGGGNVAIDAALTAKRLGARKVSVICLEKREEMPAWDYEIKDALEERIEIVNSLGPKRFLAKNGRLSGIELKKCTAVFDERGGFNPRYDETDLSAMEAETVIVAIGQAGDLSLARREGIPITPDGRLEADPITLQTSIEWVFGGGDGLYGPKTVVEAVASGKKAAESIKRYIRGEDLSAGREWDHSYETDLQMDTEGITLMARRPIDTLGTDQREGNFNELVLGFKKQEAMAEAERCLSCECHMCETICPTGAIEIVQKKTRVDEKKCVACFRCVDACQQNAIRIVLRPQPIILGVDPSEVDPGKLKELCVKARLHPRQILCLCSGTRVDEVAAAILKGAKSPEEISLMTGARAGCNLYCLAPMLRLLKAYGVEIIPPKSHRWYNVTSSIWDVPPEVVKKYPGYYLEEDKKVYRKIQ